MQLPDQFILSLSILLVNLLQNITKKCKNQGINWAGKSDLLLLLFITKTRIKKISKRNYLMKGRHGSAQRVPSGSRSAALASELARPLWPAGVMRG
jgi:hypothetical protein